MILPLVAAPLLSPARIKAMKNPRWQKPARVSRTFSCFEKALA
jgi:hypothetical protein